MKLNIQAVATAVTFVILTAHQAMAGTVTWQGPASGGAWSADANWGGAAPTAADVAVFPDGTTDVTLDAATEVSGLTLNGALTLNGTVTLTVGADGITAAAAENTIKTPIVLNGSQTWNVAASGTLIVEGVISGGASTETLTKGTGTGSLTLKGVNTFESIFAIAKGYVYLYDDATLGASAVGKVTLAQNAAWLYLSNATANRAIALSGSAVDAGSIRALANTTNLVSGAVTASGAPVFYAEKDSRLVFAGGVDAGSNNVTMNGAGGEVVISNKVLKCNILYSSNVDANGTYITTRFLVANNTVANQLYSRRGRLTYVHLDVDDVFGGSGTATSIGTQMGDGSTANPQYTYLYLHGTTQHLKNLTGNDTYASNNAIITSDEPGAKLYFNQQSDQNSYYKINGNVSLFKSGSKRVTFKKSGTTTGTLGVSAGTLELASGVTYSNVTNINVTSSGTFKTNKAGAFSRDCDVTLDGASAKLNLNFTGTNECCRLYMRNANNVLKPVKAGVYGATGSGAPNELANITGTGFLKVRKAGNGFIISFR